MEASNPVILQFRSGKCCFWEFPEGDQIPELNTNEVYRYAGLREPTHAVYISPEQLKASGFQVLPTDITHKKRESSGSAKASQKRQRKSPAAKKRCKRMLPLRTPQPEERCARVYADGSCMDNGKPEAIAGYGVYYAGDVLPRDSGLLPSDMPQSNASAEWYALKVVLEAIVTHGNSKFADTVTIYTDHENIIKTMTASDAWIKNWFIDDDQGTVFKRNGEEARNGTLIYDTYILFKCVQKARTVIIEHCKGHAGFSSNPEQETADSLAYLATADKYIKP